MDRPKMVGWYDPGQLARTGVNVLLSTIFGRHADPRVLEAISTGPEIIHDYRTETYKAIRLDEDGNEVQQGPSRHDDKREEIWIDYVADVGDGFDSTYHVAYLLAQEKLTLRDDTELPAGNILFFGGDEVYPAANSLEYQRRLEDPYRAAFSQRQKRQNCPDAFAIPGNHDWYDSLVAFSRLFRLGRKFGGCQTRQHRSYFAIRLPHGWWLLGADVQLGSDIDGPQKAFFEHVAKLMADGDKVILAVAEPFWISEGKYKKFSPVYSERTLAYLDQHVLNNRIRVYVAGDLHHYRRHENKEGIQKVTAGGGGAFLHPTHKHSVQKIKDFSLKKSFPEERCSFKLTFRNLLFWKYNPSFSLLLGGLYVIIFWIMMPIIWKRGLFAKSLLEASKHALHQAFVEPFGPALFFAGFLSLFILFTDTHSKWYRFIAGSLHGLSHIALVAVIAYISWSCAVQQVFPLVDADTPQQVSVRTAEKGEQLETTNKETGKESLLVVTRVWATSALVFIGGLFFGSMLWGLYLLVSLNVFGRHSNEAFSSLKIANFKNFLRLHIDKQGVLHIYPIGIDRVPRAWQGNPPSPVVSKKSIMPYLIEEPVRYPPDL